MATRSGSPLKQQLRVIRTSLRHLDRALSRLAPLLRETAKAAGNPGKGPHRKLRLSPARRRMLKLQGQYMGYMRQLKAKQKARVKAVKEKKGFRAAIVAARKLAKG